MSNLQRILNLASKALDKKGSTSTGAAGAGAGKSGSPDWRDLVRTAADKVTGGSGAGSPGSVTPHSTGATSARPAPAPAPASAPAPAPAHGSALSADDRAAIARYDYLLKTADPAQLEQVHRDAFGRLTPAQRAEVESRLRAELPPYEQPASASADDLARAATRGEAHKPGLLRGLFAKATPGAGAGRGSGAGALGAAGLGVGAGAVAGAGLGVAGGLLAAVAGGAVVSSVAAPLLEQATNLGVDFEALSGGLGEFATGADDLAAGATDAVTGVGEQATGLGEQLTDFGSNFEIPGLGGLGNLFDR
ncbi:cation-transporting ATPase [Herbiconiux liangxiaofengii]|uniref:cation-transporting ATPase n=1 Tax=Herbiconiux liangxiaofengii TaxID=3342795 RepID=UPI0035B806AA